MEEAKELSKLMAKQAHLQKAIENTNDVEDCQEELDSTQEKLDQLGQTVKEKTKKPVEERIRSLQLEGHEGP